MLPCSGSNRCRLPPAVGASGAVGEVQRLEGHMSIRRFLAWGFVLVLGAVACGTSARDGAERTGLVQQANSTCTHEITCSGGPLSNGTAPATGCIPPSGNANGYCVPDVCSDPSHAYCCTSTWDNGCAQYAANFT